ncbi:uncharacterized protein [Panulirus ornatus]|uniref:uncharacterized protein isoform X2 n=1 Tax=Panulirus ornatus TaxID=150431 RepID=UPI003A8B107B
MKLGLVMLVAGLVGAMDNKSDVTNKISRTTEISKVRLTTAVWEVEDDLNEKRLPLWRTGGSTAFLFTRTRTVLEEVRTGLTTYATCVVMDANAPACTMDAHARYVAATPTTIFHSLTETGGMSERLLPFEPSKAETHQPGNLWWPSLPEAYQASDMGDRDLHQDPDNLHHHPSFSHSHLGSWRMHPILLPYASRGVPQPTLIMDNRLATHLYYKWSRYHFYQYHN